MEPTITRNGKRRGPFLLFLNSKLLMMLTNSVLLSFNNISELSKPNNEMVYSTEHFLTQAKFELINLKSSSPALEPSHTRGLYSTDGAISSPV